MRKKQPCTPKCNDKSQKSQNRLTLLLKRRRVGRYIEGVHYIGSKDKGHVSWEDDPETTIKLLLERFAVTTQSMTRRQTGRIEVQDLLQNDVINKQRHPVVVLYIFEFGKILDEI
jgi:hypothetical protein